MKAQYLELDICITDMTDREIAETLRELALDITYKGRNIQYAFWRGRAVGTIDFVTWP